MGCHREGRQHRKGAVDPIVLSCGGDQSRAFYEADVAIGYAREEKTKSKCVVLFAGSTFSS